MTPGYIVAGPTGSGKSSLALDLARRLFQAVILNGDSQQVYGGLSVLTARPNLEGESIPHYLYGVLNDSQTATVSWWVDAIDKTLRDLPSDTTPIVVGGTGLYLKALLEGISPMPYIPSTIREKGMLLYESFGHEDFLKLVRTLDPTLKTTDRQRLLRAWEIITCSGHPISHWQGQEKVRPDSLKRPWRVILLLPDRADLYPQLDARFARMVLEGGLEEVGGLSPSDHHLAIGVPELQAYLAGRDTLEKAIQKGQQATRHYAKRQMTWFRHQLQADIVLTQIYEGDIEKILLANKAWAKNWCTREDSNL